MNFTRICTIFILLAIIGFASGWMYADHVIASNPNPVFAVDEFSVMDSKSVTNYDLPITTALSHNYPNPFKRTDSVNDGRSQITATLSQTESQTEAIIQETFDSQQYASAMDGMEIYNQPIESAGRVSDIDKTGDGVMEVSDFACILAFSKTVKMNKDNSLLKTYGRGDEPEIIVRT